MENNDFLTNVFRQKIDDMKKEKGETSKEGNDKATIAVITFILACMKWLVLSILSWLGWKLAAEVFGLPQITYLYVLGIMVGMRSFTMLIINPLIPKKSA